MLQLAQELVPTGARINQANAWLSCALVELF
jgi:hypothetical protein